MLARLYDILARMLLPPAFRKEYGPEIERDVHARLAATRGWSRLALGLRELVDLLVTSVREWGRHTGRHSGADRTPFHLEEGYFMGTLADLRTSARNLTHRPGLALGVTLTIGLGIGATTTIYGVVDGVVLRPLPYLDASALVAIGSISGAGESRDPATALQDLVPMSSVDYRELVERTNSFERTAAALPSPLLVSEEDGVETYVNAARVTEDFFAILGVAPTLGRTFIAEEFVVPEFSPDTRTMLSTNVAMITHGYWQRRYGGNPGILGASLEPSGSGEAIARSVVVGILPPTFQPPEPFFAAEAEPEIYIPLPMPSLGSTGRGIRMTGIHGLGRLAPGVSLQEARTEAARIASELQASLPNPAAPGGAPSGIGVNGLHAETVGATGRTLWIFLGAAALLLLLTAMNAAALLLARALDRVQELGVRTALGAGRGQLVRLLVTESSILALVGGAIGIVLSYGGIAAFLRFAPPSIPRLSAVAVDGRVLAVAALVSVATGVVVGLLPALRLTERAPWQRLRRGGRLFAEPVSGLRTALVGGQLALAVVLLSGAGLLFSSFIRIQNADPGFTPDGLVAVSPTSGRGVRIAMGDIGGFWERWDPVIAELGAVPGVQTVAGASALPFQAPTWAPRVLLPDDDLETVREGIAGYAVTPDYFDAIGSDIVDGRALEPGDGPDAERVVVVNESFVRTQLDGRDPIGVVIRRESEGPGMAGQLLPMRIVGVVEDIVQSRAEEGRAPAIYIPYTQADVPQLASWWVAVRTTMPMDVIASDLRRALAATGASTREVTTMSDRIGATHTTPRFQAMLIGAFSVVALLLAAMGLYGSLAQSVRRRQRELGVRMALGADGLGVLRMVLADGMRTALGGLAVGLIVTFAFSHTLVGLLYEVTPTDPATLVVVTGVLGLVSLLACIVPARKALSVDPVSVLKTD